MNRPVLARRPSIPDRFPSLRRLPAIAASTALAMFAASGGGSLAAAAESPTKVTFGYAARAQTWTVPADVYQATFELVGAAGGTAFSDVAGGRGARVTATIALTPGEILQINVGGVGGRPMTWANSGDASAGKGGWNGGGDGGTYDIPGSTTERGAGGGGATDVRRSPNGTYNLAARILVAGGGGGNSRYRGQSEVPPKGVGGDAGSTGSDGADGLDGGPNACHLESGLVVPTGLGLGVGGDGGSGGTVGAGGAGGGPGDAEGAYGSNTAGHGGSLGQGGNGGESSGCTYGDAPGGGGGGYRGGGGGGGGSEGNGGGGGGGGSSFGPAGATFQTGVDTGARVWITYEPGKPPPTGHRPDGRIRLGTSGAFLGNDLYGTDGAGQKVTGSALRGKKVTFGISVQNDGDRATRITVGATGRASAGYTVSYARGTRDITAALVGGTYRTASLAPGATELITVRVTVKSTAASGSSITRTVTASVAGVKDVVKLTGKRR